MRGKWTDRCNLAWCLIDHEFGCELRRIEDKISRGHYPPIAEIAESWDMTPGAVVAAFHSYIGQKQQGIAA